MTQSWTLGAIKDCRLALEGHCQSEGCNRFYVFDIDKLIASFGHAYVAPQIVPGMACTACGGSLKFMLATMPPQEGGAEG
jgi:hypothetical protein